MNILVPVVMLSWLPVIVLLFAALPPRRAVIVSFLIAWLFLPVAGYSLPGLPDYTKMSATSYGVIICVVLFDASRLMSFRFSLYDVPLVLWCLSPIVSSYFNDLGLYDGISGANGIIVSWGLPYFIGRLYFGDQEGLKELAIGIFIGALVYLPFCWYEIRMSPELHKILYGVHQHAFGQSKRWGGFRPMVFMEHGLMVGLWMASGTLVGIWLWYSDVLRRIWILPVWFLVILLLITTVLCKSAGALMLMVAGVMLLFVSHFMRTRVFLAIALVLPILYVGSRIQGWEAEELLTTMEMISTDRADSLRFRIDSEILLVERALESPIYGWGSWRRNQVFDQRGRVLAVTDSMWIIVFGQKGIIGLISLYALLLCPGLILYLRISPAQWNDPAMASMVILAIMVVVLFAYDNLANAMVNPIFLVAAGGVIGAGCRKIKPLMRGTPLPPYQTIVSSPPR